MQFCDFAAVRTRNAFTSDSSRCLTCPSILIGHDHPNKPANGVGNNGTLNKWTGAALGTQGGKKSKRRRRMFQGHIDLDTAMPVAASAIPDVLFERGLYWARGGCGVVNLVAGQR